MVQAPGESGLRLGVRPFDLGESRECVDGR